MLLRGFLHVFVLLVVAFGVWAHQQITVKLDAVHTRLDTLESSLKSLPDLAAMADRKDLNATKERVLVLEKDLKALAGRKTLTPPSSDELLTNAVNKVAPSVVSIVVSKDVPKLEVVYENPFGDDPFFRNVGIRIPRYQQKGTEVKKVGAGTGFLIRKDGYIITNAHVVADTAATYIVLLNDGTQKPATILHRDAALDIAVLKIDGTSYPAVSLGDSGALKLGQSVFAVGNALGEYSNSVSRGIISGLNRTVTASGPLGSETLNGVLQTDAAINPGNSGGPLVDLNGVVVGVNVATVRGSNNISFSIPINIVKDLIARVVKK